MVLLNLFKKSVWESYLKAGAFRSTAMMTAGAGIGQIINFFITAYLARLYTPVHFGFLATFVSLSSLIVVAASAKYDVAIVVSKTRKEAIGLFRLAIWISLAVSFITTICLNLLQPFIQPHLNQSENYNWLFLLPLHIFFLSTVQICWMYNLRNSVFKELSFIRIADPLLTGLFSIIFLPLGALGLITGLVLGQAGMTVILLFNIHRREGFHPLKSPLKDLKLLAVRFSAFPKYNILQGFLDTFLNTGILILGTIAYSASTLGMLSISLRVLQAPMGLVIRPLSNVFFAKATEDWRSGKDLRHLCIKTTKATALMASMLPITMLIAGPLLFSLIFGPNWEDAGMFARILSFWFFFELIKAPLAQIPSIVGRQKEILKYTLLTNLIFILVFLGSTLQFSALKSLSLITAYQCLQNIFFILLFISMASHNRNDDY